MSSPPYTVTKLVRWRVKDWVSCFSACKFPLEEERGKTNNPETSEGSPETVIMKSKVGSDRKDEETESSSSSSRKRVVIAKKKENGEASSSSRYPSLTDDDYIVFCFKDDGQVHVLSEKNSNVVGTTTTSSSSSNPRRFSLQLLRLEDEAERNEIDSNEKGKGKEAAAICSTSEIQEITEIIEEEEGGGGECIEISVASSDSNDQSDSASSSSFAFPIFQGEWIGSPVKMPRTQEQKPKNTLIHCCRF